MVPSVQQAQKRGVYQSVRPFEEFTPTGVRWPDGKEETVDAVIFCTGFRPALDHLKPLGIVAANGKVATRGTKAQKIEGLWLVGYGSWTGFASATLIGVGRSAKQTMSEVSTYLNPVATL